MGSFLYGRLFQIKLDGVVPHPQNIFPCVSHRSVLSTTLFSRFMKNQLYSGSFFIHNFVDAATIRHSASYILKRNPNRYLSDDCPGTTEASNSSFTIISVWAWSKEANINLKLHTFSFPYVNHSLHNLMSCRTPYSPIFFLTIIKRLLKKQPFPFRSYVNFSYHSDQLDSVSYRCLGVLRLILNFPIE